jgi:hypothetical protein
MLTPAPQANQLYRSGSSTDNSCHDMMEAGKPSSTSTYAKWDRSNPIGLSLGIVVGSSSLPQVCLGTTNEEDTFHEVNLKNVR